MHLSIWHLPFDLTKAGATQTKTPLLKQYVSGELVDLLDNHILVQNNSQGTEMLTKLNQMKVLVNFE